LKGRRDFFKKKLRKIIKSLLNVDRVLTLKGRERRVLKMKKKTL
jgi:hypothetical protein